MCLNLRWLCTDALLRFTICVPFSRAFKLSFIIKLYWSREETQHPWYKWLSSPLNSERALHQSTHKLRHVIHGKASVGDVHDPAVLRHLPGVRVMNVRGLHLRPGAHSSYLRATPGVLLPSYKNPCCYSSFCELWSLRQSRTTGVVHLHARVED